jgi:hypothetical protein
VAVIFIRQRQFKAHTWYEFLMEYYGGTYQFPSAPAEGGPDPVMSVLHHCSKRGMLFQPRNIKELAPCFRLEVSTSANLRHIVYLVPWRTTQRPKPERRLKAPPTFYWLVESELAAHVQLGSPSAFGKPINRQSLEALSKLPLNLQFASMHPPLVLYHGTDAVAASIIGASGMLPNAKTGMLGPGMYFARWDKASDFAVKDAERVARPVPGCVIRVISSVASCREMTLTDVCQCGCAKAFVDHTGHYGRGQDATYVPDNSLPATKRAEWCIRNPETILVDGVFNSV